MSRSIFTTSSTRTRSRTTNRSSAIPGCRRLVSFLRASRSWGCSLISEHLLELQLQRELHDARIIALRDESAEIRTAQVFSLVGQILHHCMVKNVEELRAELKFASLRDAEVFVHGEIHVPEAGIAKRIAARSASTARGGEAELSALRIGHEYSSSLRIRRWPDRACVLVEVHSGITLGGERRIC